MEVSEQASPLRRPRAEKFTDAGERPWLDLPNAEEELQAKVNRGELTLEEAARCRYWRERGYLILPRAIETGLLDQVWSAYEEAIRNGTVTLQPEASCPEDPFPGRFLDPHLRVPEVCRVMRHPTILHWARLLLGREPAPFQTISIATGIFPTSRSTNRTFAVLSSNISSRRNTFWRVKATCYSGTRTCCTAVRFGVTHDFPARRLSATTSPKEFFVTMTSARQSRARSPGLAWSSSTASAG